MDEYKENNQYSEYLNDNLNKEPWRRLKQEIVIAILRRQISHDTNLQKAKIYIYTNSPTPVPHQSHTSLSPTPVLVQHQS